MKWRGFALLVAGVLAAAAVVAVLVRLHGLWFPGEPVQRGWSDLLATAVALGALVLSLLRTRLSPGMMLFAAAATASLAVAVYANLGNVQFPYHRSEHFHYVLGARYLDELGYKRIYRCTAIAEAERFGAREIARRGMRDLETDQIVPAKDALIDPQACKREFSPARWRAFVDDVAWLRRHTPAWYWEIIQQDHGFNAPPSWAVLGGTLASLAPAPLSERWLSALASIDAGLLAAMFCTIAWAFGARVLWVALVVWGCQVPGNGAWTFAAFLRQDWLACLVLGVCLARRRYPFGAGVALASAAAFRVFPVLLVGLPFLVAISAALRASAVPMSYRRFAAGLLVGGTVWLTASTLLYGPEKWVGFAQHIIHHGRAPLANHVGLGAIVAQTLDGRLEHSEAPAAIDPFREWREQRLTTFAARRPLYLLLVAGTFAFAALAAPRICALWCAIAGSSVFVVALVDLPSYYYGFFVVLALLAARDAFFERVALGAVVASRVVDLVPFVHDNADLRFVAQSVVFLTWAVVALWGLAWSRSNSGTHLSSTGSK